MSSKQVAVVLRKLSGVTDWSVSSAHEVPSNVDHPESYAKSMMEYDRDLICNQFVEFKNAEWKYQVVSLQ
jgi:hypothetical protein